MERYPTLNEMAPPRNGANQAEPEHLDARGPKALPRLHVAASNEASQAGAQAAPAPSEYVHEMPPGSRRTPPPPAPPAERTIGDYIRASRKLTPQQIDLVLDHQRKHGVRFGEAAVMLKLATSDDVLWALAQQFHYPFMAREARKSLSGELVAARHPFSSKAEVFRKVRSQAIKRMAALGQRAAIAVVSPASGDGKTHFAANLAISYSQLGHSTLLIDADLRSPRMHEVFKVDNGTGLTHTLSGRNGQVVRPVKDLPNLYLLPAGTLPPNPLELVDRPTFGVMLRKVLERFDHVIVDTPAASHGADAAVIAGHCGAAIAIARQGHSRIGALQEFVNLLRDDSTHVLGMLVTEH